MLAKATGRVEATCKVRVGWIGEVRKKFKGHDVTGHRHDAALPFFNAQRAERRVLDAAIEIGIEDRADSRHGRNAPTALLEVL